MPFNPEASCKALESRIKAVERAIDDLQKLVKTLMVTRNDSRLDAIEKTIRALTALDFADKAFVEKLWDEYRKESDTERDREEKERDAESKKIDAETKAMMDKAINEAKAQQEKAMAEAMKAVIEGRLAKLEAQVAALSRK
jgi:hypothetical protein